MVAVALCLVFGQGASFAADSIYVGLKSPNVRTSGKGYRIGDKEVWDFVTYTNTSGTRASTQKNLYCVKAGVGFTSTGSTSIQEYNDGKNLKTQIDEILSGSSLNYKDAFKSHENGGYYNELLWILDNIYDPDTSTSFQKDALLKAAGIDYEADREDGIEVFELTDDEIEVAQQLALWYFTNYGDSDYSKTAEEVYNTLKFTTNGNTYTTLSTYAQSTTEEGAYRANAMKQLYYYLVNNASYTYDTTKAPLTVTTTTLNITESGSNYLVGPIHITKNSDLVYNLNLNVKDGSGATISTATYPVNASGTKINSMVDTDFYIKVPKSSGNNISVEISTNYETADATLWTSSTSNVEQPLVEVTKVAHPNTVTLEVNPEEHPFDLALRKFISKINNVAPETSRAPQVDTSRLAAGTATTATYTHSKQALKVQSGDLVEYTIRVYNEGELDGYVQEITDYILNNQGLRFVTDNETNAAYGWKMYNANGNVTTNIANAVKVKTDYLSRAKSTSNLLTAYNGGATPDYKDVKVVFEVTEPNTSANTLVNIAEITDDADSNGDAVTDRDSTPGYDKYNYPNNGYNTETHEDDIDYEPVVLKQFDLALRKFITAISTDTTIDANDYVSPSREPVLSGAWRADEPTTLVKEHPKNALPVKSGEYVLYTIRVYNEGEIDGYANLIRDNIPEGLAFDETVINHEINRAAMWTLQTDGSITTDILAPGNGAELNAVQGDANYQANLIKALKTNANGTVTVSTTDPLNPDYRDVQVLLHVVEPNTSNRTLTNRAQIADCKDDKGNAVTDRDSTPDNGYSREEDDEDFDPVKLQAFDLALRKFITSIDEVAPETSRVPSVDTNSLVNGTTATYNHTKTPLEVSRGSNIIYTIRVYNEGDIDGYASEVKDYLPEYLEFVPKSESTINTKYDWDISSNGRIATTSYLAADSQLLKAREEQTGSTNPYKIYYKEVQIECKVKDTVTVGQKVTNIAEISEYKDGNKVVVQPDRDSKSNSLTDGDVSTGTLPSDADLPTYKDSEIGQAYVPGQQDDDDFEKVIVKETVYDLALRKFITQINGQDVESRVPDVSTTEPWAHDNGTTTAKTHSKTALPVVPNDIVTYTIRVYNEGNVSGTATQITDYLPAGLQYIDNEFNQANGWELYDANGNTTTDATKAVIIKTNKLANETIAPVTITSDQETINYKDVQIQCKVIATKTEGHNLRNLASITGDNGDDIDSSPEVNPNNDNYNPVAPTTGKGEEDDDDFEEVYIPIFDLSLLKYVSQVIVTEDGNTTITETGNTGADTDIVPKVEINRKKINSTVVKFVYTIKITNEGDIAGYDKEITDYIPEGLEFLEEDNPGWTVKGDGIIATRALENTLLEPGQSAPVTVTLTWINGANNLGLKTNTAEISEDYNEKGIPDKDSTPDNRLVGEDDIDTADVLLSIKTGKIQTYFILGGAILIVLGSGIVVIRKYVL